MSVSPWWVASLSQLSDGDPVTTLAPLAGAEGLHQGVRAEHLPDDVAQHPGTATVHDAHLRQSGNSSGIQVAVYLPLCFLGAFPEKVKLPGDGPRPRRAQVAA